MDLADKKLEEELKMGLLKENEAFIKLVAKRIRLLEKHGLLKITDKGIQTTKKGLEELEKWKKREGEKQGYIG